MKRQSVRVLVASEHPGTRSLLRRMVESEDKAVIVGEAENGTKALTLARNLRPDVALIDSYLPYVVGLDNVPLSRVGGLDVAQSISDEIPKTHVVLLNDVNNSIRSDVWRPEVNAFLYRESQKVAVPLVLGELGGRAESTGSLIFANVETQEAKEDVSEQKISLSDKALFFGIVGFIAGWLMILTMFLANAGVYVALAGIATAVFGLVGKIIGKALK